MLLRVVLLENLARTSTKNIDSAFLIDLLADSENFLLPSACKLLIATSVKGDLFEYLQKFITSKLAFKEEVSMFVTKQIFEKLSESGLAELEKRRSLFENISDSNLRELILEAMDRLAKYSYPYQKQFAKENKLVKRYNECHLFERIDENDSYDYLEIIPKNVLLHYFPYQIDIVLSILDDLQAKIRLKADR